jgi:hypothetical protein
VTYMCHCGNTLYIIYGQQIRCGQCGSVYQIDPMSGGVHQTNLQIVTSNSTLPAGPATEGK